MGGRGSVSMAFCSSDSYMLGETLKVDSHSQMKDTFGD
jgi:hypothetical protein